MDKGNTLREKIIAYAENRYGTAAEYPWMKFPGYAVLRSSMNAKWFLLIMDVPRSRLGLEGEDAVNIMNVKAPDILTWDMLLHREGFMPGYHISRGNWLSVLLDGRVEFDELVCLVDMSYHSVSSKHRASDLPRAPREWLIPANPSYFDIVHAFDHTDTIEWKEGRGVRTGDTVFIYAAKPVGSLLFKCVVEKTGIAADYRDRNLEIKRMMRIRLLQRYPQGEFSREVLRDEYGIYSVRGPRGVPYSLSFRLNGESPV